MKKILLITSLFLLALLVLRGCDDRLPEQILAHRAMYETSLNLGNRYQLRYVGMREGGMESYNTLGMYFDCYRVLSKDEARLLLIDSIEEFLKQINSIHELQAHLSDSPFTYKNVEITIFVMGPERQEVYFPEISVFSANKGIIKYSTQIPDQKFGYHTVEKETYEEALEIVQEQRKNLKLHPEADLDNTKDSIL